MWGIRVRLGVLALAVLGAAPAAASTALYEPVLSTEGPLIAGQRVLWSTVQRPRAFRVFGAPLSGGAPALLGSAPTPADWGGVAAVVCGASCVEIYAFAASERTLALRFRDRVLVARSGGAFQALPGRVGSDPFIARSLAVVGDDVVSVERQEESEPLDERVRVFNHAPDGSVREIVLPAGAVQNTVAVAGAYVAVTIGNRDTHRAVALLDRASGRELRRVTIPDARIPDEADPGRLRAAVIGLDADGAMAIADARVGGVVGYAPAGATSFFAVRLPAGHNLLPIEVALAKSRLAYARYGERAVAVALPGAAAAAGQPPPLATLLYQGPLSEDIATVASDGDHLAWQSAVCAMVTAVPAPSERRVPAGPCFRAEVEDGIDVRVDRRRARFLVPLRCLTAAGNTCRVTVVLRSRRGRREVVSRSAAIPIGQWRQVKLPISAALARTLRRAEEQSAHVRVQVRLSDGAGRTKVESLEIF